MAQPSLQALYAQCAASCAATWPQEAEALVFGEGCDQAPPLMLIGEAPGEQEARQGRPFVGKAGQNLSAFVQVLGLPREALYITNVVKFRPKRISPTGRTVNRPPARQEIAFFTPWLYREIALVRPRALVTLGNVALHAFMAPERMIGDCHGQWIQIEVPVADAGEEVYALFPLYHPASVIYNRALLSVYQRDLELLSQTLPGVPK
ncbi:MAG: uracil-DNA glycosylase [Candidatus Limiplasma sp.]|nr:uracil-DNA glycosylase [Candidatus Limiplasma sp.]